jgi:hypothetical protein
MNKGNTTRAQQERCEWAKNTAINLREQAEELGKSSPLGIRATALADALSAAADNMTEQQERSFELDLKLLIEDSRSGERT